MAIPKKTKVKLALIIAWLCIVSALMTFRNFAADDLSSRIYSILGFSIQLASIIFCVLKLAGMQRVLGWGLLIAGTIGSIAMAILLITARGQNGEYAVGACFLLSTFVGFLLVFDRDLGLYRQTLDN